MYEDENNLYHYSYRKGDEQNPNAPIDTKNYAEDPWDKNPGGSPKKKGGSGLSGKIVALALVCALVGGFIGAGVSGATTKVNKTSVQVSDREVAQVQTVKVDGKQNIDEPEKPDTGTDIGVEVIVDGREVDGFVSNKENAYAFEGKDKIGRAHV